MMVKTSLLLSLILPSRFFPFNDTGLELLRFVKYTFKKNHHLKTVTINYDIFYITEYYTLQQKIHI